MKLISLMRLDFKLLQYHFFIFKTTRVLLARFINTCQSFGITIDNICNDFKTYFQRKVIETSNQIHVYKRQKVEIIDTYINLFFRLFAQILSLNSIDCGLTTLARGQGLLYGRPPRIVPRQVFPNLFL